MLIEYFLQSGTNTALTLNPFKKFCPVYGLECIGKRRTRLGMVELRTLSGENGTPEGLRNGARQLIEEWEDSWDAWKHKGSTFHGWGSACVSVNHDKDVHQIVEWRMLTFLKLSRPNLSFSTPSAPRAYLLAQTVKSLPTVWETWFNPWVRKIPWRRKWQLTPISLPGKSHGRTTVHGVAESRIWLRDFTFFGLDSVHRDNPWHPN